MAAFFVWRLKKFMLGVIKNFINNFGSFWLNRSSVKGLFVFFIFLNSVMSIITSSTYFYLDKIKYLDQPGNFNDFIFVLILVFGVLNLVLFGFWLYWRSLPLIRSDDVCVLFAPRIYEADSDVLLKLHTEFTSNLAKRGLQGKIKHKVLGGSHVIHNHEDATRIVNETGARLLIFGDLKKGKKEGEEVTGFSSISFTLRHRNLNNEEIQPVIRDLAGALAYRKFVSSEKNSFVEDDMVTKNLAQVSCFFIALGLTLDGEVKLSSEILEELIKDVAKDNGGQAILFVNSIKSCLAVNLISINKLLYNNYILNEVTNPKVNAYVDEFIENCDKLIKLNPNDSQYYLMRATGYFHFGKVKEAKIDVRHAGKIAPRNFADPYLSSAFLALWEGHYTSALKFYIKAKKCTSYSIDTIISVISFLEAVLKLHPEKIQLRYGLAIVNDHFFDNKSALKEYSEFIDSAESKKDMRFLINNSILRMKVLSLESE